MERRLKRNICNLDDYAVLSEIKDLSTLKRIHIGDALEYACQFWAKHLLGVHSSSSHVEEVKEAIEKFFTVHLLDWIEVLALTGSVGVGVYAMDDIEQWYALVSDMDFSLDPILMIFQVGVESQWTKDSQKFLLEHFDTICTSPSHIYHSALPLSPSSSWLYKCYSAGLSSMVKVVKGPSAEWGMCSRTVLLDSCVWALSYWNKTIAIGSVPGDIIILNVVTGSQTAVLSGHADEVGCLIFSPDGTSLVSGSSDRTVKLWDLQTGGVAKTFLGHTGPVWSVSISADLTTIASGSEDKTICLWDIQTGECYQTIKQQEAVCYVSFSPKNSQYLICVSDMAMGRGKIWHWDNNGNQIKSPCGGSHTAFSPDGTQLISCHGRVVTIQNSDSGVITAQFHAAKDSGCSHCCFSPDGRLVAVAAHDTTYIWDITSSDPHLVETLIGHANSITSLAFSSPSTLISASLDQSIKFWQIGALSTDSVGTDPKFTSPTSAPIKLLTFQAKDGIAITCDLDGTVKTWDILTGLCNASFPTPAKNLLKGDIQLNNGRLIFVWSSWANSKINMWGFEKGELLSVVDEPYLLHSLSISGDGSRIFCLAASSIQALSVQTGELVGKVEIEFSHDLRFLTIDGSKVWVCYPGPKYQGWDFGIPGSSPVQLSNIPTLPNSSVLWDPNLSAIKCPVSGKVVFQLSGSLAKPVCAKCDDHYLVAGYASGEVLILEIDHVLLQ